MNILVTVNKKYVDQLNIMLNSIQYSNPEEKFNIYVLHKNLNQEDILEIGKLLNKENFSIIPIKIPKSEIDTFPVYQKRYPVEIYFRLFATKYLPQELDRILYLDSDTIIINKLNELYNMEFGNNYYIAATHIKKVIHKINEIRLDIEEDDAYINTGVLLINLKSLRKMDVERRVIKYVNENKKKLILPDQDIISGIFGNKIKLVEHLKFNLGEKCIIDYNLRYPYKKIDLNWIKQNSVIIHYYGKNKPWNDTYIGKLNIFYNETINKMKQEMEVNVDENIC